MSEENREDVTALPPTPCSACLEFRADDPLCVADIWCEKNEGHEGSHEWHGEDMHGIECFVSWPNK